MFMTEKFYTAAESRRFLAQGFNCVRAADGLPPAYPTGEINPATWTAWTATKHRRYPITSVLVPDVRPASPHPHLYKRETLIRVIAWLWVNTSETGRMTAKSQAGEPPPLRVETVARLLDGFEPADPANPRDVEIVARFRAGVPASELAADYGISAPTVYKILSGNGTRRKTKTHSS